MLGLRDGRLKWKERRTLGIRVNIIIGQTNSRPWARKENHEPGAGVFNKREVSRMSADVNSEKMVNTMACASKREVTRGER